MRSSIDLQSNDDDDDAREDEVLDALTAGDPPTAERRVCSDTSHTPCAGSVRVGTTS